jgi:hypothetical protein
MPSQFKSKSPSTTRPHNDNSLQAYLWPFTSGDTIQVPSLHEPTPHLSLAVPVTAKDITNPLSHSNICLPHPVCNLDDRAHQGESIQKQGETE